MSTTGIEREIARFLHSREPEVMCIRGKWGVGKTYFWNYNLDNAKLHNSIGMEYYAYVSLFGVNSIDVLKLTIFENTLATSNIGIEPSIQTFKSNTMAVIKQLGLKSLKYVLSLPFMKNYTSEYQFSSLVSLSIRDRIICIDDIERKGDHLRIKDIMGLVSQLKERRKCKVVLILNDDQLVDDQKEEFELYAEKVIDSSLLFDPDPRDRVQIAINDVTEAQRWLQDYAILLKISNIRHLKKIERLVLRATSLLRDFNPIILQQTVQSLTLLGWSFYSKGVAAPTIDFIVNKYNGLLSHDEELSDNEKEWYLLLKNLGFIVVDEFDRILLEGIKQGYFDDISLTNQAVVLQNDAEASESRKKIRAAWDVYHDSFDDNQAEVANTIIDSYYQNIQSVSPSNLDSAVRLLKKMEYSSKAKELIEFYLTQRASCSELFDLSKSPFANDINDPDVIDQFTKVHLGNKQEQKPIDILLNIEDRGLHREDVITLSTLDSDDFYVLFKTSRGEALRSIVRVALLFSGNVFGYDCEKIASEAKKALKRIGSESLINKIRVQTIYQVKVSD